MKKLFALTLVLSMILALCPINSFASSTSGTYGDLVWSFDSATGVLAVSGTGEMNDRESYQSVPWSAYEGNIVSITIANGVTSIGDSAFSDCKKLTSVIIPDSVRSIGFHAFSFCEGLETVTIGNGVTTIDWYAFFSCDNLTNVTFGNSVKEIGDYAFSYCESLKSIELPDSVTTIGGDAFYWCLSLTDLTIGKGVSEIGKGAFSRCDSLTNVVYNGTEEEWKNIYIGDCNEPLMNAYDGSSSTHYNSYWEILDDGTKQFVCADCGEVQKTLGADEFIPNDINGDNKFDMFDYVAVKNCVMKGADDEALLNRADVNGDGKINIFDYVAIKAAYFVQ